MASRKSHLDREDIKAVLEAQRAKIAALQRRERHQQPRDDPRDSQGEGPSDTLTNNPVFVRGTGSDVEAADVARGVQAMEECLVEGQHGHPGMPEYPVGRLFTARVQSDGGAMAFLEACEADHGGPLMSCAMLPPQMQERMLCEDLLSSFEGFQGNWIRFRFEEDGTGRHDLKYSFGCEAELDPSMREMVMKMIPLSKYVMMVKRFSETENAYSSGLVNQALAGAMRGMLLDWDLMIAQIESQLRSGKSFTLQALWYYVQSPLTAFQLVAKIASDISSRRLRGSDVLSYLHDKADKVIGDPLARKFMSRILATTTEPYFNMLERWICDARVDDPYGEFVVKENQGINMSDLETERASSYWTDKFTIRYQDGAPCVPVFLQSCLKEVLNTGKYLDLVRTCGHAPERPLPRGVRLEYDEEGTYLLRIKEAYETASRAAVHELQEHNVLHGLEGLKKYFLTAQGDLFLAFMDAGDIDLKSANIPMQQLQDILQLSVEACSVSSDPMASSLEIVYGSKSLHQLMLDLTRSARASDGDSTRSQVRFIPPPPDKETHRSHSHVLCLQLRPIHSMSVSATEKSKVPARNLAMLYYRVPWPLVVIAPDSAIAQYQAFFKHLFDLKWVERELNKTCKLYQSTRMLANFERRAARRLSTGGRNMDPAPESIAMSSNAMKNLMLAYNTCQTMVHFFRQYLLYSSFELLDPLWKALEDNLKKSSNVDEMIEHHMTFLERTMKGLFLSRKLKLPPALFKVEELALDFVKLTSKHLDIDYIALDRAAESSVELDDLQGRAAEAEKRRFKARRVRAVVDAALTNPLYETQLRYGGCTTAFHVYLGTDVCLCLSLQGIVGAFQNQVQGLFVPAGRCLSRCQKIQTGVTRGFGVTFKSD